MVGFMQMQTLERLEGLMDFSEGNKASRHYFVFVFNVEIVFIDIASICTLY